MRYCIWYGICDLFNKKILTFVSIAMFIVSFAVIENSGLFYMTYNFNKWQAGDVIETSFEGTYKIDISKYSTGFCGEEDRDNIIRFLNGIEDIDGVSYSGLFFEDTENAGIPVLFANRKILNMCGIPSDHYGDFICLAGKNTGYNKGEKFQLYGNTLPEYSLEITDITEEGRNFIASAYFDSSGQLLRLDDYMIVSLEKAMDIEPWYVVNGLNNIFFAVQDDFSGEQVIYKIRSLAKSCGVDLYGVRTLNECFDELAKYAMENAGANYLMPFIMVICSTAAMVICSLYSIRLNKKDYGIMLVNGMTHRDIACITGITVEIKIVIAFAAASLYTYSRADAVDPNGIAIFNKMLPVYIVALVMVSLIVTVVSVITVNRDNAKNIIEGTE